ARAGERAGGPPRRPRAGPPGQRPPQPRTQHPPPPPLHDDHASVTPQNTKANRKFANSNVRLRERPPAVPAGSALREDSAVAHTLLTFHAHPDDEAIATAGVMAKAVAEGHRVVLVVATKGEHAAFGHHILHPAPTISEPRIPETH